MDIFLIISVLTVLLLFVVAANVIFWPRLADPAPLRPHSVSVLIPARNEECNLPRCLDSVLQQGETIAEVLVYDDHSTDATAEIVNEYSARDGRVQLIEKAELPVGWCGKNFACTQLAAAAKAEWLLFLDADARLKENAVARMVEQATRRGVTLLSCWPGLVLVGFWEKTLMPMLNFVVLSLFPAPLSMISNHASLGLAHGACLLVHRATYLAVGGHAAVRDEIFEDTRLARLWRATGRRGLCLNGQDVTSVRMYGSFAEIWRGFEKNFFPAFRHETSFWLFIALHLVAFFAPFIFLNWSPWAAIAAACVMAMRSLLALRFRHPWWSILLHPLSELVVIAIALSSWWRYEHGSGVAWKDRVYHAHGVRRTGKA